MSFVSDFVGGITGADSAAEGAQSAAKTTAKGIGTAITSQQGYLEAYADLMRPYLKAGERSLSQQQSLLGLRGAENQAEAIANIEAMPGYTYQMDLGEQAILQNQAATGGVRGGNTQAALAQFAPQFLQSAIDQQLQGLSGLTNMGFQAATQQGQAGLQTGQSKADLYTQQAQALAGGQMAAGQAESQGFGNLMSLAGLGIGAYGAFGGLGATAGATTGAATGTTAMATSPSTLGQFNYLTKAGGF